MIVLPSDIPQTRASVACKNTQSMRWYYRSM